MLKRAPFTHNDVSIQGHTSVLTCKQDTYRTANFHTPICLFYPFSAVAHCPLSSRKKKGMFGGEEQNRFIPHSLQGDSGLLKLCLPVMWQVSWISQRELSSIFTELHNCKYNERLSTTWPVALSSHYQWDKEANLGKKKVKLTDLG